MTSSNSNSKKESTNFTRLHPRVQEWVYDNEWAALRDVQEQAIAPILAGANVILSAPTSDGKTEAAFLPILSVLANTNDPGIGALCVSPLKALINDQFERLSALAAYVDVPVARWHGDVAAHKKDAVATSGRGLLLITPESLEALLMNRGPELATMLANLRYVVVDELHAFAGTARGAQLQSLLSRVDLVLRRRVPRIGLSATLSDTSRSAEFLCPGRGSTVSVIDVTRAPLGLVTSVRGYEDPIDTDDDPTHPAVSAIARNLYTTLSGSSNLIFANQRAKVEELTVLLNDLAATEVAPRQFFAHHGNLSKAEREHVEDALKDPAYPASAVCTSTLELGIDVGAVSAIAQVGLPPSVSSLRQRIGRSGRRGGPPCLYAYITEPPLDAATPVLHTLRTPTIQMIAAIELMLEGWVEDPRDTGLNLSTLIQQILSLIAQHSGVRPADAYRALCGPGPFSGVDTTSFATLLRSMAAGELIIQTSDGVLLHGPVGERLVNHYSFYATFVTEDQYRVVVGTHVLGEISTPPAAPDAVLVFAGRRWRVIAIDTAAKVISVEPAGAGAPPAFPATGAILVDPALRQRMLEIYQGESVPDYLDDVAARFLAQGRATFAQLGFDARVCYEDATAIYSAPWDGDRALATAALLLSSAGVDTDPSGALLISRRTTLPELLATVQGLLEVWPPDLLPLAHEIAEKQVDKWDWVLSEPLLDATNALRIIDLTGAKRVLETIAAGRPPGALGF